MKRLRRLPLVTCAVVVTTAGIGVLVAPRVQSAEPIRFARAPRDCVSLRAKMLHTPQVVDACLSAQVWGDMRRTGVRRMLVALQRDANANPVLKLQCHLPLHEVGQRAWRERLVTLDDFPRDLPADANWNSSCPGGFLHGMMQAAVTEKDLRISDLVQLNDAVCAPMDEQDMKGCAHSVGHGAARASANDLRRSSAACERMVARTVRDCISGTVMEFNLADLRIRDRQRFDGELRAHSRIRCRDVSPNQRNWCRLMKAKGAVLLGWWGSGA